MTGERIRDKFAASKKKGMWMGGTVPLGYSCRERKLVVNESEAATVRTIFNEFLRLGCVRSLQDWLRENNLTVADSDSNFVLFGTFADRHKTWQALLDRGVLIRETGPAGWLRVTVGTPDEMAAFKAALKEVL